MIGKLAAPTLAPVVQVVAAVLALGPPDLAQGLAFLRTSQDSEGCFGAKFTGHYIYNHAIATLAMAEAYGMTGSPVYRESAQKALDFVAIARNPYFAWRYGVKPGDNDTSVTTWMMLALHRARLANTADLAAGRPPSFTIDEDAFEGAKAWVEKMTDPDFGRVGYQTRGTGPARPTDVVDKFPAEKSESMTAAGILIREILGEDPKKSSMIAKGAALCEKTPPAWSPSDGSVDLYYWHYGMLALPAVGGRVWSTWQAALRVSVVDTQRRDTDFCMYKGSWDNVDPWGRDGGRIYSTAMALLCIEAPARSWIKRR